MHVSPYCSNCGAAIDAGSAFCTGCGTARHPQAIEPVPSVEPLSGGHVPMLATAFSTSPPELSADVADLPGARFIGQWNWGFGLFFVGLISFALLMNYEFAVRAH